MAEFISPMRDTFGAEINRYYTNNEETLVKKIADLDLKIQDALEQSSNIYSSDIASIDRQIEDRLKQISSINKLNNINEYKKKINDSLTKKAKLTGDLSPKGSYIKELIFQRSKLEEQLKIIKSLIGENHKISVKEDGPYKLKIFRETDVKENHVYYTGRFVACYLNPSNKYYDYAENGKSYKNNLGLPTETYTNYAITKENFAKLALSIPTTKSYVIATSSEQTFVPILPPSDYLEVVNFTKLFVYGYVDSFVSDSFQKTIKPEIKQYLETIDADKFLSESTTLNSDAVSE